MNKSEAIEKQIASYMKSLKISRDEAIQLMVDDGIIDHMKPSEVNDDLSEEQKKVVKNMKNSDTKTPTAYKFTKRERKEDKAKSSLIKDISQFLEERTDTLEITKPEREIVFTMNGEHFTLQLIKNRKKKE